MNKRKITSSRGSNLTPVDAIPRGIPVSVAEALPVSGAEPASISNNTTGAFPIVRFNEREFEIHPLADRTDKYAYDDSVDFLLLAVPMAINVYGKLMKVVEDNPNALAGLAGADLNTAEGQTSAVTTLIEFLSHLDSGEIIKEVASSLPSIAAIACHYSDADVLPQEIKEWTKTPLHIDLWRAVLMQLKAENIMGQFSSVQKVISEFSSQAA